MLLLDGLPEFPRSVLESLRQPLKVGIVGVARVGGYAMPLLLGAWTLSDGRSSTVETDRQGETTADTV